MDKERPCYDKVWLEKIPIARCHQSIPLGSIDSLVDIIVGAAADSGNDRGDDGQEECGGSKEDEAGQGVVAVALAVGTYPDDYSRKDDVE
jgi:hypothetical protein